MPGFQSPKAVEEQSCPPMEVATQKTSVLSMHGLRPPSAAAPQGLSILSSTLSTYAA
jgi:hypothetical protein